MQAYDCKLNETFDNMTFNLTEQVNIRFTPQTTLDYFKSKIMSSEGNEIDKVDFFTITGARLPLTEKVEDLNDFPIICQVN